MKGIIQYCRKYIEIILVCMMALTIFVFVYFREARVNKHGVFTIAKVLRYETSESGSFLYFEIYLGDKRILTSVDQDCNNCIGNYYFVKVSKDNPDQYPILFNDRPVPECIITGVKYFKGWEKIPNCNEYQVR